MSVRINERELANLGFSQALISWFRGVDNIVQPGEESLDISEIEALQHEFRLMRNELDELRSRLTEMEFSRQIETPPEELLLPRPPGELAQEYIVAQDPLRWLQIARGQDVEYTETHKFGTYESVGTTFVPIARLGVYQVPTTAQSLEVVSSDANDTSAGSGARTVTVVGLNSAWAEVEQDVTMNGTTAVTLGTDLIRAYRMYVKTSGTYATATAGSHAGDITLRDAGGAGSDWLQIYSGAGADFPRGQSECGAFTVPTGKSALVALHYVSIDSTKTGDIAYFQRDNADTVSAPYDGAMRAQTEFVGLTGFANMIDAAAPLGPFVGPCDVGFMGKVSTGTGSISVDFEIVLYDT